MTFVNAKKFKGTVDLECKLDGFEEGMWKLINKHITQWLKEMRIDVYPINGKLRMILDVYLDGSDKEIIFDMPYEEFFQERNDEPPDMEEFLVAGLKYYRDMYDREPGRPDIYTEED